MTDQQFEHAGATLAYDITGPENGPLVIAAHGQTSSRANEDASGFGEWHALPAAGLLLLPTSAARIPAADVRSGGRRGAGG